MTDRDADVSRRSAAGAIGLYAEAARFAASTGDGVSRARRLLNLGATLAETGDAAGATGVLDEALVWLEKVRSPNLEAARALRASLSS